MDRREGLLYLADLTGIKDAQGMDDASLEYNIDKVMTELINQFYMYTRLPDDDEENNRHGKKQNDEESPDAAQEYYADNADDAFLELGLAEKEGYTPDAGDTAEFHYSVLNALNKEQCIKLYELRNSGDKTLSDMATNAFILSVRGSICSLIKRVHFQWSGSNENTDPIRQMRSAGIEAALSRLTDYNPTLKGTATFFSYSYIEIWKALLGQMYGYDYKDDSIRNYYNRVGKIKNAIVFFKSQGVTNPTDDQIAAYINQNTSRNKEHQLSAELVRMIRKSPGYNANSSGEPEETSQDDTSDLDEDELLITVDAIANNMPPMEGDVIRIIVYLMKNGEAAPDTDMVISLLKKRYPETEKRELGNAVITAKKEFRKQYFGEEHKKEAPRNPLFEAILSLEDYTDDIVNLIENTDISELF